MSSAGALVGQTQSVFWASPSTATSDHRMPGNTFQIERNFESKRWQDLVLEGLNGMCDHHFHQEWPTHKAMKVCQRGIWEKSQLIERIIGFQIRGLSR
jgi:hypothetical protein